MENKPLIFMVDDEPMNLKYQGEFLRSNGYDVTTDSDPINALKTLKDSQDRTYDLFIFNYMMPGIDGLELSKQVDKIDKLRDTPVIITTAWAPFSLESLAGNPPNIKGLLSLPFHREELRDAVRTTIEKYSPNRKKNPSN